MLERVAVPVGHRAIEFYCAVRAELEHFLQPRIIWIGRAVHVAPSGGAHVAALTGQPGPAALGGGDPAVERAQRMERAGIAGELAHRAVLGGIQRYRPAVASAVEHGDRHGLIRTGEWRR